MLKLDSVKVSYGAIEAVRGVSLEVPNGEVVTIIGANGAGKSTLLKSIVGLEPVAAGRVLLDGKGHHLRPAHKQNSRSGSRFRRRGAACFPTRRCATTCCSGPTRRRTARRA